MKIPDNEEVLARKIQRDYKRLGKPVVMYMPIEEMASMWELLDELGVPHEQVEFKDAVDFKRDGNKAVDFVKDKKAFL